MNLVKCKFGYMNNNKDKPYFMISPTRGETIVRETYRIFESAKLSFDQVRKLNKLLKEGNTIIDYLRILNIFIERINTFELKARK